MFVARWARYLGLLSLLLFFAFSSHATVYDLNSLRTFDLNIHGGATSDTLGASDIVMGDADADGSADDLVLLAPGVDYNGRSDTGAIYLILNAADRNGLISLANTANVDAVVYGHSPSDQMGGGGVAFGDADGDGYKDDLAVVSEFADSPGRSGNGIYYIFLNFGLETGRIDLNVAAGRSRVDMNLYGATPSNSGYGTGDGGIAWGDADADGNWNDLVVQSVDIPYGGTVSVGKVFLIKNIGDKITAGTTSIDLQGSGSTTVPTNVSTVFRGSSTNNALGGANAIFGDVDNDGYYDDLIFGGIQTGNSTGGMYLVKSVGTKLGMIEADVNSLVDVRIWAGGAATTGAGYRGGSLIDANGDGLYNDLLVHAHNVDYAGRSDSGAMFLFKDIQNESGTIDLLASAGVSKIDLNIYGSMASNYLGYGDSALGDLDGDGIEETLAVTAYGYDYNGSSDVGAIYLISGIAGKSGAIDLNAPSTDVNHFFYGPVTTSNLGYAGVIFTDADRDGVIDDLFIQAHNADTNSKINNGAVWYFDLAATSINSAPSLTLARVDGNPFAAALPSFSYFGDGNLTIDFNASDTNSLQTLTADINYSDTNAPGSGTVIRSGFVLSSTYCSDNDFTNTTTCSYDFNISSISDGNYFILMKLSDGNLSTSDASDRNFMVDNTAATTTSDANNATWQTTDANVHLTCSDGSGSGCASTRYQLDTDSSSSTSLGNWTTFDYNILISSDGKWEIDFNSTDNAGNRETTNQVTVYRDATDPTISISAPTPGENLSGATVTLEYTGSDATSWIASYSVSTDGNTYTSNGTATTYSFSLSEDGNHTLYVRATDNAGNTADTNVTIAFDYVATSTSEEENNPSGSQITQNMVASLPVPIPTSERTAFFNLIPAGEPVKLFFGKNYVHPVTSITLVPSEEMRPNSILVTTADDFPPLEEAVPCDYFGIAFGKKTQANIEATIRFRVEKSCVEGEEATAQDVRLFHHAGEWVPLETTMEIETEDEYYFSAKTTGFSPFASGIVREPPPIALPEPIAEEKPRAEAPIEVVEQAEPSFLLSPGNLLGWIIIGVIVVVALHYAHDHHRRKKRKRKPLDLF